jgi:hypothetical protein
MGVTIHYAGRLRKGSDLQEFLGQVEVLAKEQQWRIERLHNSPDHPDTGFVTYPNPECEPLQFEFDLKGRLSGWVKTQFAGPQIHIEVIEFLRQVKHLLGKFGVRDEGEYWATGCEDTLRKHFNTINGVIQEAVENNPRIRVGVHRPNGRIWDYIE